MSFFSWACDSSKILWLHTIWRNFIKYRVLKVFLGERYGQVYNMRLVGSRNRKTGSVVKDSFSTILVSDVSFL